MALSVLTTEIIVTGPCRNCQDRKCGGQSPVHNRAKQQALGRNMNRVITRPFSMQHTNGTKDKPHLLAETKVGPLRFRGIKKQPQNQRGWFLMYLACALVFILIGGAVSCSQKTVLETVFESQQLIVVTRNNAHSYYTYREQEMGFEYELAKAFADYLGVDLVVKVAESWTQMFPLLDEGLGHVVAASVTITPSRQNMVDFSKGYLPVQQMVIVHKKNKQVKKLEDLSGKVITVRTGTSYEESLKALQRGGLDIVIKTIDNIPTEELIAEVALGHLDVTVSDSNIALLNRRYYPDIRIAFPIEKSQSLGWAVKRGEHGLREKIDAFFEAIEKDGTFKHIYNRYYAYLERFDHQGIKKFKERMETRFPQYEKTIRKAASSHGFDWRLIAALIYQESQFRPWAKSFSGVRGLMQLTLPTAREMGVTNRLDPVQSIRGGTKYLKKLYNGFPESAESDRILLAIAAYNVGKGHVTDAQDLAKNMNLDPHKWTSLEKALPLLRQRKYHRKSKHGYCRGSEPVYQVRQVVTYYDILKREAIKYGR